MAQVTIKLVKENPNEKVAALRIRGVNTLTSLSRVVFSRTGPMKESSLFAQELFDNNPQINNLSILTNEDKQGKFSIISMTLPFDYKAGRPLNGIPFARSAANIVESLIRSELPMCYEQDIENRFELKKEFQPKAGSVEVLIMNAIDKYARDQAVKDGGDIITTNIILDGQARTVQVEVVLLGACADCPTALLAKANGNEFGTLKRAQQGIQQEIDILSKTHPAYEGVEVLALKSTNVTEAAFAL